MSDDECLGRRPGPFCTRTPYRTGWRGRGEIQGCPPPSPVGPIVGHFFQLALESNPFCPLSFSPITGLPGVLRAVEQVFWRPPLGLPNAKVWGQGHACTGHSRRSVGCTVIRGPTRLLGNDVGPLSIWTKLNKGYYLSCSVIRCTTQAWGHSEPLY